MCILKLLQFCRMYKQVYHKDYFLVLAGAEGIEPPVSALEADGLPLTDAPNLALGCILKSLGKLYLKKEKLAT